MEYIRISLNGDYRMMYHAQGEYTETAEPEFDGNRIAGAVPGYWEDMVADFRMTAWGRDVRFNPTYTLQRYPMGGYLPDMTLPNVQGCMFYRRTLNVPSLSEIEEVRLFVGGAQNTVSAWINGHFLGCHRGYSAPFSFTVPKEALCEGSNRLTLAVSNMRQKGYMDRPISGCTSRAANECTGGIYGDVELRLYTGALRDVWVSTAADMQTFTVHAAGGEDTPRTVTVKDGDKTVLTGEIPAGASEVSFPCDGLRFWSPADPYRYAVEVSCGEQTVTRAFGIRRLSARGTTLYFNGEPFYARGICEHGYYPLTAHPPRDKGYYRRVIRTIKSLGFNLIRFHTWVPMAEYMEAADELGILMEVETPNNTTYAEWQEIVSTCRRYTAPVAYSSGNEMVIDEDYIAHLRQCADLVHTGTDSLFSPMSAMRGVEYFDHMMGPDRVEEPFRHDPKRLRELGEFCDMYNNYPLGQFSYFSETADPVLVDHRQSVYGKPLLSHEICIQGTYCDLSLADRYRGTRIGETELYSSVERHLADKGLLDRAPAYYRASSEWQRRLRKQCFEAVRRSTTTAGYDYLGDIDHHWHTFGYCVGMMNEFYELKPGETLENVRRYNADTVLLADLPRNVNYPCGAKAEIPLLVSHYGKTMDKATLRITLSSGGKVYLRRELRLGRIEAGSLTPLYTLTFTMPRTEKPQALALSVSLSGGDTEAENRWELYTFPMLKAPSAQALRRAGVTVAGDMDADTLCEKLQRGETVVLFGAGPFATLPTSYQIALAGRTDGHLAALINDDPLMEGFPHEGFCGWQCRDLLNGGKAVVLDLPDIPFAPAVEMASTYKNARREAALFSYRVGTGKLLVCTLHMGEDDPAAAWLRARILNHVTETAFAPLALSWDNFYALLKTKPVKVTQNTNLAENKNDITM